MNKPFPKPSILVALRDVLQWLIDYEVPPGPAVSGTFTVGGFSDDGQLTEVMNMATGIVGQRGEGMVRLEDDDPRTEGATYETVSFESEDGEVAAVAASPDDPLKCTILLLTPGTTRVLCHVDPGAAEAFHLAVNIEAQARQPGAAVGGTFEVGTFEEVEV